MSGVLGGVETVSGILCGASAVLALRGHGGPLCGPAAGAWIVAGRLVLGAAVIRGGSFAMPAWAAGGAAWRRYVAGIMAAGGPHAVGALPPFGILPKLHSLISGRLAGLFPALTRRELVWSCDSTTKKAFAVSKKSQKNKKTY